MLDIHRGDAAAALAHIEFLRIELAPLMGGEILCSLTATTVDEDAPQLLDQEIASSHVANVEDVLALIRTHVRIGSAPNSPLRSE